MNVIISGNRREGLLKVYSAIPFKFLERFLKLADGNMCRNILG